MRDFEYYVIMSDGSGPLLSISGSNILLTSKRIENPPSTLTFVLGDPIDDEPELVDYMVSPQSIVSKKIYGILDEMNISKIQLFPAIIRNLEGDPYDGEYWAVHIANKIRCIDTELSDCEIDFSTLGDVKKIILDKKILSKIPLEDRLVFQLGEHTSLKLYHVSVKEAIESALPKGVGFINIENWTWGSYFSQKN